MTRNDEQAWDEEATLPGLRFVGEDDGEEDGEATLHGATFRPIPALHRTPEEAEDTACAQFSPLRLDQLCAW